MSKTPPIADSESFPCVVIASQLRDTNLYPITGAEQTWLDENAPMRAGNKPWETFVRYKQTETKTFVISELKNKTNPEVEVQAGRQEGGDGGGGGDAQGGYFLDMLETRTGTTFWRVESKPPQQIQWRPTEKEIFRRPKDDNGYDLATPTVGTVAQKIIARDDPCAAWFFETAGAALDMLNMAGSPIHNLFGDVRVIAVKR